MWSKCGLKTLLDEWEHFYQKYFYSVLTSVSLPLMSAGGAGVQSGEDASGNPRGNQPVSPSSSSPSSSTSCLPAPHYGPPFLPHASPVPSSPNGWHASSSSPTPSTSPCAAQTQSLSRYRQLLHEIHHWGIPWLCPNCLLKFYNRVYSKQSVILILLIATSLIHYDAQR